MFADTMVQNDPTVPLYCEHSFVTCRCPLVGVVLAKPSERGLEPVAVASGEVALDEVGRHRVHDPAATRRYQPQELVDLLPCGVDACRKLRSRADAELAVDLREVPRDRVRAQAEL